MHIPSTRFRLVAARNKSPGRFTSWIFPLAVAGILGTGAILFSILVPVPHRIPESFTISVARAGICEPGPNFTTPRDGTLEFSWMTNDSIAAGSLSIGSYSMTGAEGSGSVQVLSGEVYSFFFCGSAKDYVQISGAITYGAPLV
jgi:hypothetical protein